MCPTAIISEMMSWKLTQVCILLGMSILGSEAISPYSPLSYTSSPISVPTYTNTSISEPGSAASTTNLAAARTTISSGAAITSLFPTANTSCGSVNFTTYLVPSLQNLPSAALEAYFASGYSKLNNDLANIERYANSPITDTVAYESFILSELSTISVDIDSLYGPGGNGIISFQNIAISDPCLFTACLSSYATESSLIASLYPPGVFDFYVWTPAPPCCGQCTIQATGVQLAYWPTPAPTPPVSVLINQYNVSYVSPSFYVFFTSLNAKNLCGPIGSTYPIILSKYGPTDLSTSSLATSFVTGLGPALGMWESIDYADFDSPKCKCTTGCQYDSIQNQYLTEICTPQLSMPPGVSLIDPLWSTCGTNLFGVFDPPIALTIQPGLTTPKSTPAQPTSNGAENPPPPPPPTSAVAVNGPTATVPIPPPTTQPYTTYVLPTPIPKSSSVPPLVIVVPVDETSAPASPTDIATKALAIVVNGQTVTANSPNNPVIGTQTLTTNPQGNVVIGTQTLTAGGSAITISGTTISLPSVVIAPPASIITTVPAPLLVNGQTVTANSQGDFVVGSQTLTTNSQGDLLIGSQTLTADGPAITISGTTILFSTAKIAPPARITTTLPAPLIVNGQTITANSQGNFVVGIQTFTTNSQGDVVIGSQTLTADGPAITVSGSTISLGSGATEVIYGGTSTTHLGSIIQSFMGAPAQYTGSAAKEIEMDILRAVGMAVGFWVLMVWV